MREWVKTITAAIFCLLFLALVVVAVAQIDLQGWVAGVVVVGGTIGACVWVSLVRS